MNEDFCCLVTANGWLQSQTEPSLFTKRTTRPGKKPDHASMVLIFVDDLAVATTPSNPDHQELQRPMATRFTVTGGGDIGFYLGCDVHRNRTNRTLTIDQQQMTRDTCQPYIGTAPAKRTPTVLPTKFVAGKADCPRTEVEQRKFKKIAANYRMALGGLLWIHRCTRPGIGHAMSAPGRYASNPGPVHVKTISTAPVTQTSTSVAATPTTGPAAPEDIVHQAPRVLGGGSVQGVRTFGARCRSRLQVGGVTLLLHENETPLPVPCCRLWLKWWSTWSRTATIPIGGAGAIGVFLQVKDWCGALKHITNETDFVLSWQEDDGDGDVVGLFRAGGPSRLVFWLVLAKCARTTPFISPRTAAPAAPDEEPGGASAGAVGLGGAEAAGDDATTPGVPTGGSAPRAHRRPHQAPATPPDQGFYYNGNADIHECHRHPNHGVNNYCNGNPNECDRHHDHGFNNYCNANINECHHDHGVYNHWNGNVYQRHGHKHHGVYHNGNSIVHQRNAYNGDRDHVHHHNQCYRNLKD